MALIAGGILHLARAGASHEDGSEGAGARDDHAIGTSALARTDIPAQAQARAAVAPSARLHGFDDEVPAPRGWDEDDGEPGRWRGIASDGWDGPDPFRPREAAGAHAPDAGFAPLASGTGGAEASGQRVARFGPGDGGAVVTTAAMVATTVAMMAAATMEVGAVATMEMTAVETAETAPIPAIGRCCCVAMPSARRWSATRAMIAPSASPATT
ncbi:MAG: hypothetical protein ACKOGH_18860 [Alphaproteobacteria bacterium]